MPAAFSHSDPLWSRSKEANDAWHLWNVGGYAPAEQILQPISIIAYIFAIGMTQIPLEICMFADRAKNVLLISIYLTT